MAFFLLIFTRIIREQGKHSKCDYLFCINRLSVLCVQQKKNANFPLVFKRLISNKVRNLLTK